MRVLDLHFDFQSLTRDIQVFVLDSLSKQERIWDTILSDISAIKKPPEDDRDSSGGSISAPFGIPIS